MSASASSGPPLPHSSAVAMTTGHHLLKIDGYSQLTKLVPAGDHIEYPTFQAAGRSWHINCYPNGCGELILRGSHEFVSLQLVLDGGAAAHEAVMARFTFSQLSRAGVPALATVHRSPTLRLAGGWWFLNFIRKARLERPERGLLRDDSFTVRCDIAVLDMLRPAAKAPAIVMAPPPPDLCHHLGELLSSEDGADVALEAGGETFNAHRCVLAARSPVFKATLLGPMKESTTSHGAIRIEDMDARVFKAVLQFIYTDTLPEMNGLDEVAMSQHLLEAADRFGLQKLKIMCEDKLRERIDTSSVATTLALAEQHGCQELKERCLEFLRSTTLRTAMAADGFSHLASSCPAVLEEIMCNASLY
ncbi:hypothetical protein ACP70R_021246 [Stipagrostis hirtigluma subsp. patula]